MSVYTKLIYVASEVGTNYISKDNKVIQLYIHATPEMEKL